MGLSFGNACKDRGIAVLLAPVLDVALPAAPDVIKARSFGKDRDVVQALGLAFSDGTMQAGVFPVVKHYPGHGAAKPDPQTALAVIELSQSEELAKVLYPFAQAVVAGVPGMLVGHIAVPRLDEAHPQRPASLSPILAREFLRNRWAFKGVILSDDIALAAAATGGDVGKAAVLALAAGCDALILADPAPERIRGVCDAIETAVNDGTSENLNESKRRLEASKPGCRAQNAGRRARLAEPGPGRRGRGTRTRRRPPRSPKTGRRATGRAAPNHETRRRSRCRSGAPLPVTPAEGVPNCVRRPGGPKPAESHRQPRPNRETRQRCEGRPGTAKTTGRDPCSRPQRRPACVPDKPGIRSPALTVRRVHQRPEEWNKLDRDKILLGQKLRVSPPNDRGSVARKAADSPPSGRRQVGRRLLQSQTAGTGPVITRAPPGHRESRVRVRRRRSERTVKNDRWASL